MRLCSQSQRGAVGLTATNVLRGMQFDDLLKYVNDLAMNIPLQETLLRAEEVYFGLVRAAERQPELGAVLAGLEPAAATIAAAERAATAAGSAAAPVPVAIPAAAAAAAPPAPSLPPRPGHVVGISTPK
jgi:hypothetical protein